MLDLDLDVDSEAPTAPSPLDTLQPEAEQARVLVVDADLGARLYLRARLSMAKLTQVDEAATGVEALKLMAGAPLQARGARYGTARHRAPGNGQAGGGGAPGP
jgi:hypothetical protein